MLVSLIIPAYKAERWIAESVGSALAQEGCGEVEVIVVDDGSNDGTAAAVASIGDPRLRLIRQPNLGQSAALNRGISAARGDYLKFLDADDLLAPGHLAAQLAALEGTTRHLGSCRWAGFRETLSDGAPREAATDRDYEDPVAWILDSMELDEGMMPGWRWLIPRAVLEAAGGWDERLSLNNDFEFSIRLLLHSEGVRFAPRALLHYRQAVAGSLSKRASRAAMESAWLTTRLGCAAFLAREDGPRARRLCADRMQDWLFRFYPEFPDLAAEAEAEVARLGGSGRAFPGGRLGRAFASVLPWKAVRRAQVAAERLGWRCVREWKGRYSLIKSENNQF